MVNLITLNSLLVQKLNAICLIMSSLLICKLAVNLEEFVQYSVENQLEYQAKEKSVLRMILSI